MGTARARDQRGEGRRRKKGVVCATRGLEDLWAAHTLSERMLQLWGMRLAGLQCSN